MRKLTIAVQMDPMPAIDPAEDSTVVLMQEAQARGHAVHHYTVDTLSLKDGMPVAHASPLALHDDPKRWYTLGAPEPLPLVDADVVLMRQDPPFDMAYITATHLLERLRGKTLVANNPVAVRNYPEKIFPLQWPEFIPPTLISANAADIRAFHREQGEIVLKPLYGHGGAGVFHINRDGANLSALLELMLRGKTPLIAQRFLPEVKDRERRIVLIDGTVAGIVSRTPARGEIRANVHSGGTAAKAEITGRQREICDAIGPMLQDTGLLFAGLDVVGDWLIELNITSPTGLAWLKRFYGTTPERDFWDAVEQRL